MTQKPTGVFVQFPLTEAQVSACSDARAKAWIEQGKPTTTSTFEAALLAIGTSVHGEKLEVCATIERENERYVPEVISFRPDIVLVGEKTRLVRQSEAKAQIAARDAEIMRLREALDALENSNNNLCFMRSKDTYQSMLRDGCKDLLEALDRARLGAREALKGGAA
ncbi:GIL1 family protein [Acetobacter lovaniensis]|uniref:Uncharacterized protein n=1 Tax=Acetobacter lovaniensis TaxID=104100 RepID=A0A841QFH6_9PROT|nr:GIL1 family protein [Acetobacter lovaniensis]MBB6456943.1 hypothetical protein [Acetobacter lovaniensis]NHN81065.1 hypothetical protein [Acetobacter lovaniensis]GBQ69740.1 hypothetical protein AA0474_2004 [Acetobacter lovaniensis NRIC 0474]